MSQPSREACVEGLESRRLSPASSSRGGQVCCRLMPSNCSGVVAGASSTNATAAAPAASTRGANPSARRQAGPQPQIMRTKIVDVMLLMKREWLASVEGADKMKPLERKRSWQRHSRNTPTPCAKRIRRAIVHGVWVFANKENMDCRRGAGWLLSPRWLERPTRSNCTLGMTGSAPSEQLRTRAGTAGTAPTEQPRA